MQVLIFVASLLLFYSGYMAPEYAMHGQFSVKSDVFSFGVLVLETITGQKINQHFQNGESDEELLSFVSIHLFFFVIRRAYTFPIEKNSFSIVLVC